MTKSEAYPDQNSGDGTWSELFSDVYSGVAVGIGHSVWFVGNKIGQGWETISSLAGGGGGAPSSDEVSSTSRGGKAEESEGRGPSAALSKDAIIRDSSSAANANSTGEGGGLRVVGVGYGRTGTYSLALALDELGFPTLHTQHLYENPEIFDRLVNNVFYKSIQEDDVIMGDPDFDLLLKGGFTATMDLPFALYFENIRDRYPDCKFILTVRENSDVWFRSWDVLARSISKPAQYTSFIFTHVKKLEYYMRWLFSVVNSDKVFLSTPFPFPPQNKANAVASYESHNQRVRDSIPSSQLLEYNVREGWEPLCKFLAIPEGDCPSANGVPFPRSNSARSLKWQTYSSFIGPMMLSIFILFSLFSIVFRKVTGMSVIGWCCLQKARFLRFASNSLERRSKKRMRAKMN